MNTKPLRWFSQSLIFIVLLLLVNTTGGEDQNATEIRAYLIPNHADPFGDLSSYPMISVTRSPN